MAAEAASIQEILTLVATGRGVCLVPGAVVRDYPRGDVSYVNVTDADPAVVWLAWTRETRRPDVEVFIGVARRLAGTYVSSSWQWPPLVRVSNDRRSSDA